MKYIIMADGKGTRWNNYNDIPKHFAEVNGEPIIVRTIRLLNEMDKDSSVIVTSHDPRYDIPGSSRHEPENNVLEIDRFTSELIENDVCFLYGDTYYSEKALKKIIEEKTEDMHFFGNSKSIVAVKVHDGDLFREHVLKVRQLFVDGKLKKCIGWQVYQSFTGLPFEEKIIGPKFTVLDDDTEDFNTPEEYNKRK